ncbi:hypothetical protein F4808DRAFT_401973 [Astrocystis sublimbata]|nr:hypothetical protein F4808DRAFT_401973 [Astrocystis sublimbata]
MYPVLSMQANFTHAESRVNLLGPSPSPEDIQDMSMENHITSDTPPAFFFIRLDDAQTLVDGTFHMVKKFIEHRRPVFFWVEEHGGHGGDWSSQVGPALIAWSQTISSKRVVVCDMPDIEHLRIRGGYILNYRLDDNTSDSEVTVLSAALSLIPVLIYILLHWIRG